MSENSGNSENGNEAELEEYDYIELDGEKFEPLFEFGHEDKTYLVLTPVAEEDETPDDGEFDFEFVVLEMVENGDEIELSTIDDEELYDRLGEIAVAKYEELEADEESDITD